MAQKETEVTASSVAALAAAGNLAQLQKLATALPPGQFRALINKSENGLPVIGHALIHQHAAVAIFLSEQGADLFQTADHGSQYNQWIYQEGQPVTEWDKNTQHSMNMLLLAGFYYLSADQTRSNAAFFDHLMQFNKSTLRSLLNSAQNYGRLELVGYTPMQIFLRYAQIAPAIQLAAYADFDIPTGSGSTLFHVALAKPSGDRENVAVLNDAYRVCEALIKGRLQQLVDQQQEVMLDFAAMKDGRQNSVNKYLEVIGSQRLTDLFANYLALAPAVANQYNDELDVEPGRPLSAGSDSPSEPARPKPPNKFVSFSKVAVPTFLTAAGSTTAWFLLQKFAPGVLSYLPLPANVTLALIPTLFVGVGSTVWAVTSHNRQARAASPEVERLLRPDEVVGEPGRSLYRNPDMQPDPAMQLGRHRNTSVQADDDLTHRPPVGGKPPVGEPPVGEPRAHNAHNPELGGPP